MKNITRQKYRSKKTWSWLVRVCVDRPKGARKYFYDRDYGGSLKAKAAAERYLKGLKQTLPKHFFAGRKGIAWGKGTRLCWMETYYKGWAYSYLTASAHWTENGTRRQKSFSCNKYGIEEAKALAAEYRDKMIRELGLIKVAR